jgi:GMP synthase (glutamine-hydrolysing)
MSPAKDPQRPRKVVLVRHGDEPPDDRVSVFLHENGFEPVWRRPFAGEPLGELGDDVAGSVVYGGKYAVYETAEYPFLLDEARWIEACMKKGVPLLGICQGGQQIAHVMGAHVGPPASGAHEFGYYELIPTAEGRDVLPAPVHVAQAHFHTFDIPAGAVRLAGSELFPNQAFRAGDTTYAFQFHPEVTIEGFRRWQASPWAYYGRPGAQSPAEQDRLMLLHDAAQAAWFYGFLGRLFDRSA